MSGFDMSGYMTVAERIAEFREKHPDGSLQPANPAEPFRVVEVEGQTFIAYTAVCHRGPTDRRPGIGVAWEPVPGKTSFTKDSELQNAETSAWGRAIVAALASDTRKGGIATREEVQNRQNAEESGSPYRQATLRTDVTSGDVARMKIPELSARLRDAGLDNGGTLKALRERLTQHLLDTSGLGGDNPSPDASVAPGATGGLSVVPDSPPVAVPGTQSGPCFAQDCPEPPLPGSDFCEAHSG